MRSPVRIRVAAPDNPEGNPSGLWFYLGFLQFLRAKPHADRGWLELLLSLLIGLAARQFGPHTPAEDRRACSSGAGRVYILYLRIPGAAPDFSLRLGHTRGKTTLSCFLTRSCRCATQRKSFGALVLFRVFAIFASKTARR